LHEPDYDSLRKIMVEEQLRKRGITDPGVLAAFLSVPRHLFVDADWKTQAYEDRPLPIGAEQTISQPYMAALMTQWLCPAPEHRLLEIGTGSGYQAAVLSLLAHTVFTVERIDVLYHNASKRLTELGYRGITPLLGDGSTGHESGAPYDGILVTAGAPEIPEALLAQLKEGGMLVAPVGDRQHQRLIRIRRHRNGFHREEGTPCRFVPLLGAQGWQQP